MGLYDEVLVPPDILHDIPDEWEDKVVVKFQTKNIQRPGMDTFRVENDNLLKKHVEREEVGTRTIGTGDEAIEFPTYETVEEWWANCHYHGSFEFHKSWPPDASYGDDNYQWFSYEAWFNQGELQEVLKNPDR